MQKTVKKVELTYKESFNLRFKQFLEEIPENRNKLAAKLNVGSGQISSIEIRGSVPGLEFAYKLGEIYPWLNINWLVTGEGEMHKRPAGEKIITATVTPDGNDVAIYVPVRAQSGYLAGYGSKEYLETLPAVSTPFFNGHDCRFFEIKGDSMEPTIYEKDIVFCQRIYKPDEIKNGRVYVLVDKNDGVVVKRLQRNKKSDYVTAYSDNKFYEPYSIELKDIAELWYFRRRITAQAPPPGTLEDRVYELEKFMFEVQKKLGEPRLKR